MTWLGDARVLGGQAAALVIVVGVSLTGCGRREVHTDVRTLEVDPGLEVRYGSSSNSPPPPSVVLIPSPELRSFRVPRQRVIRAPCQDVVGSEAAPIGLK